MPTAGPSPTRDVLLKLARILVFRPEMLEVETAEDERGTTLHLRAHAADVPILLGEGGRTFRALSVILSACAAKVGERVKIEVHPLG